MRRDCDLVKMFPSYLTGEDMFGLTEPSLLRIIESMPGIDGLKTYAFKFGRCQLVEMPLAINPTGCARSEPKLRTHFKRSRESTAVMTGASRSIPSTICSLTSLQLADMNAPYMKHFVQSKAHQYRKLKVRGGEMSGFRDF